MSDPNRGLRRLLATRMPADMAAAMPAEPTGARVVGGKAARAHGAALEAWLTGQHRAAAVAGIAHVRHVGAPVIVGAGGRPTEWAGTGPADYQGVLKGGRALAVEAKSRDRRLALSDVAAHQRADLEAVERLGGVALLVVELRASGSIYVVPWGRVGWRRCREGAADVSVGPEELALWRWTEGLYLARWIGGAT